MPACSAASDYRQKNLCLATLLGTTGSLPEKAQVPSCQLHKQPEGILCSWLTIRKQEFLRAETPQIFRFGLLPRQGQGSVVQQLSEWERKLVPSSRLCAAERWRCPPGCTHPRKLMWGRRRRPLSENGVALSFLLLFWHSSWGGGAIIVTINIHKCFLRISNWSCRGTCWLLHSPVL